MWPRARAVAIASAAAVLAAFGASSALACSCAMAKTPTEHLKHSDVVFKGRVLRTTGDGSRVATTFQVSEVLKGPAATELTIEHYLSGPTCGLRFTPGDTRIIFAHRYEGKLSTSSCSMQLFSEAEYRAALGTAR